MAATLVSTFSNLLTTMLGSGVLTMPYAIRCTGAWAGVWLCVAGALIVFPPMLALTMILPPLVGEHGGGTTYFGMASKLLGPTAGVSVSALFVPVLLGVLILFAKVAIDSLQPFLPGVPRGALSLGVCAGMGLLALPKSLHQYRFTSSLSLIALGGLSVVLAFEANSPLPAVEATAGPELMMLQAAGIWCCAFGGHVNLPSLFFELPSARRAKMPLVMIMVLIAAAVFYLFFGLSGLLCYSGGPPPDVLLGFPKANWAIDASRLLLAAVMMCKAPLIIFPLRAAALQLPELCRHARVGIETAPAPPPSAGASAIATLCFAAATFAGVVQGGNLAQVCSVVGSFTTAILVFLLPGALLLGSCRKDFGNNCRYDGGLGNGGGEQLLSEVASPPQTARSGAWVWGRTSRTLWGVELILCGAATLFLMLSLEVEA